MRKAYRSSAQHRCLRGFRHLASGSERRLRGRTFITRSNRISQVSQACARAGADLHLADVDRPVGVPALERAILWARYLETHASRAYGSTKTLRPPQLRQFWPSFTPDISSHLSAPVMSGGRLVPVNRQRCRPDWAQDAFDYDWLTQRKLRLPAGCHDLHVNPKAMKCIQGGTAKTAKRHANLLAVFAVRV